METAFAPWASPGKGALIPGSVGFGIGWGIAGFCPGSALPARGPGDPAVFPAAPIGGLLITRVQPARARARKPA